MNIKFIGEAVRKPSLKYKSIKILIEHIIIKNGFMIGNLTYIFCSDNYLKDINCKYLQHDYYTDIVTFDYSKDNKIEGDMFISIDRVKENSVSFNTHIREEFLRVIIHGILHLLGSNDTNEIEQYEMTRRENEYLDLYKYLNDENFK